MVEEKKESPKIDAIGATIGDLNERVGELEKAVGLLMGFVKGVLPTDFERWLKKEIRLAERSGDKEVLELRRGFKID